MNVLRRRGPETIAIAFALAATLSLASPPIYRVEPALTNAEFTVVHLGISKQRGRFEQMWGSIEYDPVAASGHIEFVVDAASVNTGWNVRDAFIRSEDLFDTEHYPVIRFHSTHLHFRQGRLESIDGELTLRGVTRPVRFAVARIDCGKAPDDGRDGCGAEATGTIRRTEFGMDYALLLVGDEVELRFLVTAFRVPDVGEADTY